MDFIQWIASIWGVLLGVTLIRYHSRIGKRLGALCRAPKLNAQSQQDQYVRFTGRLAMPVLQAPFSRSECGYWAVTVRAEFKTKKKKPQKGTETHTPMIYRAESNDMPLLMRDSQQLVQVLFKSPFDAMQQATHQTHTSRVPPLEAVQALADPKYQRYITDEYYLPLDTPITVWGTVLDRNAHCVTLSGSPVAAQPATLLQGEMDWVLYQRGRNRDVKLLQLGLLALYLGSLHTWMPSTWPSEGGFLLGAVIGMALLYLVRYWVRRQDRQR